MCLFAQQCKMDCSRTTEKNSRKLFIVKKSQQKKQNKSLQKIQNFFIFLQVLIHETKKKKIVPRSLTNLKSGSIVIYYTLYNFFYTQLASAFVPQKDFYYIHNDTDTFFLFLLQKDAVLFRDFLCVFDNIYVSFLYIEKRIVKNILVVFLYPLKIM